MLLYYLLHKTLEYIYIFILLINCFYFYVVAILLIILFIKFYIINEIATTTKHKIPNLSFNHLKKFFLHKSSDDVREKMRTRYLSNPDYNFEKVNRASMACGPMVKWAIAQVINK